MGRGMQIAASLLAAVLGTAIPATPGVAANLDLGELAAALAFPVITGGQRPNALQGTTGDVVVADESAVTLASVTNGKSGPVRLKVDVISGDAGEADSWRATSFDCDLTAGETTVFVFEPDGSGSRVSVECSDLARSDPEGKPQRKILAAQNGILFVAAADADTGAAISEDVLFGDAVIIDKMQGQAYSFGAIPFQAGKGQNNGDKVYKFDDQEYAQFPSVLATNFLAPTAAVDAELILFTLDGGTGSTPVPRVKLGGVAFNDDEQYFDFTYVFDCFDVVSLLDLDPNFVFDPSGIGLGSMVGHVELSPQPIAPGGGIDAHDAQFGDANNTRRRPVHGWIVQATNGPFVPLDQPVTGTPLKSLLTPGDDAAWGRELSQSRTPARPFLADQPPVLNANTRL